MDTAQLEINAGGTLKGNGFVDLEQAVTGGVQVLENSGILIANTSDLLSIAAGTLTLDALSGMIDLDGDTETGVVTINRNDTLTIIGGNLSSDAFSGTMNLADGANFNPDNAWSMSSGDIEVNTGGAFVGSIGAPAQISGAQFTMSSGTITLDTADVDRLQFNAPFVASSGTIANSNEVIFNNTSTINAGVDFQMNGSAARITLLDNATVTINDANFNLDGSEHSRQHHHHRQRCAA